MIDVMKLLRGFRGLLVAVGVVVADALAVQIVMLDQKGQTLPLDQSRMFLGLIALLMGGLLLVQGLGVVLLLKQRPAIAWRMSFRLMGWLTLVIGAVVTVLVMLIKPDPRGLPFAGSRLAVEAIMPLVAGVSAAFALSPDDEPALEVTAAGPRPLGWLLGERLLATGLAHAALTVTLMLVSLFGEGERNPVEAILRWLPAMLLFMGLGAYITLRSRQPAMGAALVGLLWFGFAFMGVSLLPGVPALRPLNLIQPIFWAFYAYLQPQMMLHEDYLLNRWMVTLMGLLLMNAAIGRLRDEETLLFGKRARQMPRGGAA